MIRSSLFKINVFEKELIQSNKINGATITGKSIKKIEVDFADLNFLNLYTLAHF